MCCSVFHIFSSIWSPCAANRQRHFSISIIKNIMQFSVLVKFIFVHIAMPYLVGVVHSAHHSLLHKICTYFPDECTFQFIFLAAISMATWYHLAQWIPVVFRLIFMSALSRWFLLSLLGRNIIIIMILRCHKWTKWIIWVCGWMIDGGPTSQKPKNQFIDINLIVAIFIWKKCPEKYLFQSHTLINNFCVVGQDSQWDRKTNTPRITGTFIKEIFRHLDRADHSWLFHNFNDARRTVSMVTANEQTEYGKQFV